MRAWEKLPEELRRAAVRPYYERLCRRRAALLFKRLLDILLGTLLFVLLFLPSLLLAAWIKLDSPGPVFYRQERVTRYGKRFRIFKFRTMVAGADRLGSLVTVAGDRRVTRAGRFLRRLRLDEVPQLLNILAGQMSFVGTRPEVPRYVARYTDEMRATLLLPAGLTSLASIEFKDEDRLLDGAADVDRVYTELVLPRKMAYNVAYLRDFSLGGDLRLMLRTLRAVLS